MVHFVGPPDGTYIGIITPRKPFHTVVNDHIMNQELSETISHDSKADGRHPPGIIKCSKVNQQHAGYGKDDKEEIILFKKTWLRLVMIPMQGP